MSRRVLVAGVGNIFFGDDGFGVEVVRRLREEEMPAGVEVRDIGIRGIHLLYELMDGCELLVLVDVAARGRAPGTVSVLEPDVGSAAAGSGAGAGPLDAHGLAPDELLAAVAGSGTAAERTVLVVCEPRSLEPGIGLSPPVREAVPAAARTVAELARAHLAERPPSQVLNQFTESARDQAQVHGEQSPAVAPTSRTESRHA